jgi:hypothetical protein
MSVLVFQGFDLFEAQACVGRHQSGVNAGAEVVAGDFELGFDFPFSDAFRLSTCNAFGDAEGHQRIHGALVLDEQVDVGSKIRGVPEFPWRPCSPQTSPSGLTRAYDVAGIGAKFRLIQPLGIEAAQFAVDERVLGSLDGVEPDLGQDRGRQKSLVELSPRKPGLTVVGCARMLFNTIWPITANVWALDPWSAGRVRGVLVELGQGPVECRQGAFAGTGRLVSFFLCGRVADGRWQRTSDCRCRG